ncbi:MAG: selenide, water dikinase [Flaviaesturariibacter sp.]|nr:selenide, water dikinase [Flaviaesturariibacter sp.]
MEQETTRLTQFSKGGGCGCKIAPAVLQQILGNGTHPVFSNLLVGNDSNDDAAVYRLNETTAVISTTDFFVPIVDDPFDFGRIASANAISDVYAMGGTPVMAIAILGWPIEKLPVEQAQAVLDGARAICAEAGIPLAGGHTIDSADPIFGLAVTGTVSLPHLKRNDRAEVGDILFLTKPVGVGVLSTALKRGLLASDHYDVLLRQMTALNKVGEALGAIEGVHAMTDVTGFGLLGHAIEMATGSGVGIELQYAAVKQVAGLGEYLRQRTIPDATFRNWNAYSAQTGFEKGVNVMEAFNVLPDPQTNGGLLIAVSPGSQQEVANALHGAGLGDFAEPIGRCVEAGEKTIRVTL